MPEFEGSLPGNYISPWQDFKNLRSVQVVEGRNGNPTLEARTPCGWIFHFVDIPAEHFVAEPEVRRFADVLTSQLVSGKSPIDFDGWELIGAEAGSQAASFSETAETRAIDSFWRGSRIGQLHEEHSSNRDKWS